MPASHQIGISDPERLAARAEEIYREKFQTEYEAEHLGKFVVIDIDSGRASVHVDPAEALRLASESSNAGRLHLIRVGSPGAFRVSRTYAHARSGFHA